MKTITVSIGNGQYSTIPVDKIEYVSDVEGDPRNDLADTRTLIGVGSGYLATPESRAEVVAKMEKADTDVAEAEPEESLPRQYDLTVFRGLMHAVGRRVQHATTGLEGAFRGWNVYPPRIEVTLDVPSTLDIQKMAMEGMGGYLNQMGNVVFLEVEPFCDEWLVYTDHGLVQIRTVMESAK